MLEDLHVYHISKSSKNDFRPFLELENNISCTNKSPLQRTFFLETCQRMLWAAVGAEYSQSLLGDLLKNYKVLRGHKAYAYLLEVTCGLKSTVTAENEVASQMKTAFNQYLNSHSRCPKLMKVLQKVLQDSKSIRRNHLKSIGQKTYSGIVRSIIQKNCKVHSGDKEKSLNILILGSGQLAKDVANQLRKKHNVYLSARNTAVATSLCAELNITCMPWSPTDKYLGFDVIVNTIGVKNLILFDKYFFDSYLMNKNLFIDLGSPSTIEINRVNVDGLYVLDDILKLGAIKLQLAHEKIKSALFEIEQKAEERVLFFKRPKCWDQTQRKSSKLAHVAHS